MLLTAVSCDVWPANRVSSVPLLSRATDFFFDVYEHTQFTSDW